jgi:hypothetical protein
MNERIKEFAQNAGLISHFNAAPNRPDIEKFAELIVKECAYIVENSPWRFDRGYKAIDQANLVKQHFEVE